MKQGSESPSESIANLQARIAHVPSVGGEVDPVSEQSALVVFALLEQTNPTLFKHIKASFRAVVDYSVLRLEPVPDTTDVYVARLQDIQAIVARAAIAAAAQVALDIGTELGVISELRALFASSETDLDPRGESPPLSNP